MSTRCPTCGEDRRVTSRGGGEVRCGPVHVSVDPRTMPECGDACPVPQRDLARAIDGAIDARMLLATGRTRSPRCGGCTAALDLPMRSTVRSLTIEPDGSAPFTLTFALPVVRCGDCGHDNVPTELAEVVRRSAREVCGANDVNAARARTGLLRRLLRRA